MKNMKRQWNIGVDMDGVQAQYDKRLFEQAHKQLGLPLHTPDDAVMFNSEDLFDEQYRQAAKDLALQKGFFANLEPFPGVVQAMREMIAHPRLRVWCATAPKKQWIHCVPEKYAWIAEHIDPKLCDRMIMGRDKSLYDLDVLFDDKPHIDGVKKPSWKQIYYDRPYNRVENGGQDLPRIVDWSDWKAVLSKVLGEEL